MDKSPDPREGWLNWALYGKSKRMQLQPWKPGRNGGLSRAKKPCPVCGRIIAGTGGMAAHLRAHASK